MTLHLDVDLLMSTNPSTPEHLIWIFSSTKTNGLDSFLCGAMYDYGFAGDSNYAQQIHHRLFESTNPQGETRRNDIVSINTCRGREHGIPGYNAYRELCGLRRANQFQDFADTMTGESIQKMQMLYK